jgi:hypothetical protein
LCANLHGISPFAPSAIGGHISGQTMHPHCYVFEIWDQVSKLFKLKNYLFVCMRKRITTPMDRRNKNPNTNKA